jgi:hypothetical protein
MSAVTIKSTESGDENANWLEVIRQQVGSLRYGVVQIVIHDSQVTQIEKQFRPTRNLEAQIRKQTGC